MKKLICKTIKAINKKSEINWKNPSLIDIYKECSIKKFDDILIYGLNDKKEWEEIKSEHKNGGWFFQDELFRDYYGPFKTKEQCQKAFNTFFKNLGFVV
jgi:hypothetical protein